MRRRARYIGCTEGVIPLADGRPAGRGLNPVVLKESTAVADTLPARIEQNSAPLATGCGIV